MKQMSILGISADGPWIHSARQFGSRASNSIQSTTLGGSTSFPNSILLPRFPGEPYRLDMGAEPHPRGSGLAWPPEALVDPEYGAGRLPVGLVLENIESENHISWRRDTEQRFVTTEALAGSIAQMLNSEGFDEELVFVIPNRWGEELQQRTLDAFHLNNLRCRLLWRPVAAALEWFDHFEQGVSGLGGSVHSTVGKLLSLYIGYDHVEITELELVVREADNGQCWIVPGRKRPGKKGRLPSFGYRRVIQQLAGKIDDAGSMIPKSERFAAIWNRIWCTRSLDELGQQPLVAGRQQGSSDAALETGICRMAQMDLAQLSDRIRQLREHVQRDYTGIVVSGELASAKFDESSRVWEWMLNWLDTKSQMLLVEGYNSDQGLLARGACRFAHRLEAGLPTYLDTLPRMEMVISENGEPTWIDLLEPNQKWVDGGRLWERPERIRNLSIAAGSVDLKLAVAHEEFDFVREVVTDLPESSETDKQVSLSVQMIPAQGKARIEIHPEQENLFGDQRVFIDWRKMTDYVTADGETVTKQGYLDTLPRIFPELLPRIASSSKWRKVGTSLRLLQAAMESDEEVRLVNRQLEFARDMLREKDQKLYPQDATAFNSDGECNVPFRLDDFMKVAWKYYSKHRPSAFIRAMAYTHTSYPKFIEHILEKIESGFIREEYVVAAGKCFRKPEHIATFIRAVFSEYGTHRLTNPWWKAISEMLRFREDATRLISSEDCLYLMQLAGEVFESERKRGSGKEVFRTVCLVIVYTLRRRAFDDQFLEPESELAEWIKKAFRRARNDAKSGRLRLIGGSVDLAQQLQLIIDYVDRKGKGQLLIGG